MNELTEVLIAIALLCHPASPLTTVTLERSAEGKG